LRCYVTCCAIWAWFTRGRVKRVVSPLGGFIGRRVKQYMQGPEKAAGSEIGGDKNIPGLGQVLSAAFWDDPTDVELLQEPVLSWHLARPGLFLVAFLVDVLTTILGILGVCVLVCWFE